MERNRARCKKYICPGFMQNAVYYLLAEAPVYGVLGLSGFGIAAVGLTVADSKGSK
jgi:hypothetical protein